MVCLCLSARQDSEEAAAWGVPVGQVELPCCRAAFLSSVLLWCHLSGEVMFELALAAPGQGLWGVKGGRKDRRGSGRMKELRT